MRNIPTVELVAKVLKCSNATGRDMDKFAAFGVTPAPASIVRAPLIAECYASLECRVFHTRLNNRHDFFVLEVVMAWVDPACRNPHTLHHRGRGLFAVSGATITLPSRMQ